MFIKLAVIELIAVLWPTYGPLCALSFTVIASTIILHSTDTAYMADGYILQAGNDNSVPSLSVLLVDLSLARVTSD